MKRTLIATLATLLVASGASALSLTLDTDKASYNVGETITVTATLDTTGAPADNIVDDVRRAAVRRRLSGFAAASLIHRHIDTTCLIVKPTNIRESQK